MGPWPRPPRPDRWTGSPGGRVGAANVPRRDGFTPRQPFFQSPPRMEESFGRAPAHSQANPYTERRMSREYISPASNASGYRAPYNTFETNRTPIHDIMGGPRETLPISAHLYIKVHGKRSTITRALPLELLINTSKMLLTQ